MNYENLLNEAQKNNIYVIEDADFKSKSDGLINGNVIGINKNIRSYKKRSCVLAEEIGHYYTTTGDIIDQSVGFNNKQEYQARLWAYNRLIGLSGIIDSHKKGCKSAFEMAEHLNVTEDFLAETLHCYKAKYGVCAKIDNYIIYFEPSLGVFELI